MKWKIPVVTVVLLLAMTSSAAQHDVTYKLALPGYRFVFPRDHASHPDYKLEWWYFTGQVRDQGGREFGYDLTFFRTGVDRVYDNPSQWTVHQLYMAHFAISDLNRRQFHFFEKVNREGPGIAGAQTDSLHCWNENWSAQLDGNTIRLHASAEDTQITLALDPERPPVVHGENGISQKGEGAGHASHYYSITRLRTTGMLTVDGESRTVEGESWMDHEFGTNQLTQEQIGWDWFSMTLDNGVDLMLYRMRRRDGSIDSHSGGTIVQPDLHSVRIRADEFRAISQRSWKSPKTNTTYPVDWRLTIPSQGVDLTVSAIMDDQELVATRSTGIAYWEGAIQVQGTWKGRPVHGRGYLELTGYAERFRPSV